MAHESLSCLPIVEGEGLTLKQAAFLANSSPDTVARWARRFGIGRQVEPGARWLISEPGLRMVLAVDADALEAFRAGDRSSSLVLPYLKQVGEPA